MSIKMTTSRASTQMYYKYKLCSLGSNVPYELVESLDVDNEIIDKYPWSQLYTCLKCNKKYYACKLCCDGSGRKN